MTLAVASYSPAQQDLLPDHFGKWTKSANQPRPGPDGMPLLGLVVLSNEVGDRGLETRDFYSGNSSIRVSLRKLRDPSSAYEAYTAEINPEMHPSTVSGPSAIDRDRLILLIGSYIVEVQQPQIPSTAELQELVARIRKHSDQTPLPPIRMYLPAGFTDGTQKYALGPVAFRNALTSLKQEEFAGLVNEAGFALGAEAIFAHYRAGKDEAVLLLIEYPTPQLAEQHLRHLEQVISPAAKQAGTTIERNASLLTLVLKPTSTAYGKSLRSAVNYETHVTWNEPTHTITDPPWAYILAKIFFFTGIFMVVAIALGAAFGGVRVVAKSLFPGKFFDRPEQMDVLQLGLSSKRIDSRDFY
jgi:hypothetical protein